MQVDPISRERARLAPKQARPSSTAGVRNFRDLLQQVDPLRSITLHTRPATSTHTVKAGESLSEICREYLQSAKKDSSDAATWAAVQKVARSNGLKDANFITPGQVINLGALQGSAPSVAATSTVAPASTVPPVIRQSNLPPPMASSAVQAVTEVKSAPSRATSLVFKDASLSSTYLNQAAKSAPRTDLTDLLQSILAPPPVASLARSTLTSETAPAAAATPHEDSTPLTGPWAKLLSAPAHLTSEFGVRKDPFTGRPSMHGGIDLAADKGSKIYPIEPGTVTFSGWMDGYGKVVFVHHQDGLDSVYGHNASNLAKVGQKVTTKTPIGLVGATGRATGAHLHFEIRKQGQAVDPIPLMKNDLLQVAKTF